MPATPAPRWVLGAVGGAAVVAAVVVPADRVGLGWFLAAVAVAGAIFVLHRTQQVPDIGDEQGDGRAADPRPALPGSGGFAQPGDGTRARGLRTGWLMLGVALMATSAIRDATWLFVLCLLGALACVSLSVSGGRSARALVLGSLAVWVAGLRALPWLGTGLRDAARSRQGGPRIGRALLATVGLLVVFGSLFAGADAAFADLVSGLAPDISGFGGGWVLVFGIVVLLVGGAALLLVAPLKVESAGRAVRRVRLVEWALPVGILLLLFALFIGVQVAVLFGGDRHVTRTAGLTYAEYARSGFWQLLVVTALTLGVIAVAARLAPTETAVQRIWLRGLLGGLTVATLVIVTSALSRLWLYQETYGFTVLRLLVGLAELWLGLVCLMVLAAGIHLAAAWLPRAAVGAGLAALLALVALNPEGFIAQWNVERYAETQRIDTAYLGRLSADAVPALAELPEPVRGCVLDSRLMPADGPLEWNWGRARAADFLDSTPDCALDAR